MVCNSRGAKFACLFVMIILGVTLSAFIWKASVDGECGRISISTAFASLSPCMAAATYVQAKSWNCAICIQHKSLMQINPHYLYAVFHSPAAKFARIVPVAAMSIPKRCNIKNRRTRRNA
ncbi:hypothetical protein ACJRO7_028163 [Eucalyptus globulus]|uniref:Uncharacterized protein n=1 Tax=Eucalyptus globulus TaxID=34317 RepID=A0ABD3JYS6_EUCGL